MSLEEITNTVANINPEPVGIFTLPNQKHLKYKNAILKILKETPRDSELFANMRLSSRLCHDNDLHIFEQFQQLKDLEKDIHTVLISYISRIGSLCDRMVINDAWVNEDGQAATLGFHYHTNSYLSGTYYVNYDNKMHTPLSFVNDRFTANRKGPSIDIPENENLPTAIIFSLYN